MSNDSTANAGDWNAGAGDGDAIDAVTHGGTSTRWLFTLTILVGSFLLFLVQPMVARMALPRLGGAPAVWNSAMLVYQALLLGGYAWAHWIGRFPLRRQAIMHASLLAIALILCLFPAGLAMGPMGLRTMLPPSDSEVFFFVPVLLLTSVGPLLFAVSAQAPLMQRWFADSAPGANPYALYAASNLGSFGGLVAYPLIVEPTLRLYTQSWGWTILYVVLFLLVCACGVAAVRYAPAAIQRKVEPTSPAPAKRRVALWIALAAVPSGLMLSTTTHLTTDIMAMPLMWAIPLGLYLLSFTVAFSDRRWLVDFLILLAPPLLLLSGGITMMSQGSGGLAIAASSPIFMLFTVSVALHSRLYHLRPETDRLTFFYLMMAVGGALGGLFCALIAPLVFNWVYEHPILIVCATMLIPLPKLLPWAEWLGLSHAREMRWSYILAALLLALGGVLAYIWTGYFGKWEWIIAATIFLLGLFAIGYRVAYVSAMVALMFGFGGLATLEVSATPGARTRSYFGIYTVRTDVQNNLRILAHGTTLHGEQILKPALSRTTTSYYGPYSGVGLAFQRAELLYGPHPSIGVVGLGTGTLTCYRKPNETWQVFEIDPAMVHVTRDSGSFTFVRQCAPNVPIHLGDARLTLAHTQPSSIDLLAVDAFSSDAIPLHLLTKQAFDVYARALRPNGIALIHISNRFVNLEPVLLALQEEAGWHGMLRYDKPDDTDTALARTGSIWVAMSRDPNAINALVASTEMLPNRRGVWRPLDDRQTPRLWTDDYASVMPLLIMPNFWGHH